MDHVFLAIYIIWFTSEIVLNRMLRSNTTDQQGADKNSLLIIWAVIIIAVWLAITASMSFIIPITNGMVARYAGSAIILIGVALRIIAVITLGKFFTVDVTIREGHRVVKHGLYKYFRHPSYTASLLTFIGFGISLNNWASLALITLAVFGVFTMRIRIEEKTLIAQFGHEYLAYKKQAWGLVPFMY